MPPGEGICGGAAALLSSQIAALLKPASQMENKYWNTESRIYRVFWDNRYNNVEAPKIALQGHKTEECRKHNNSIQWRQYFNAAGEITDDE